MRNFNFRSRILPYWQFLSHGQEKNKKMSFEVHGKCHVQRADRRLARPSRLRS